MRRGIAVLSVLLVVGLVAPALASALTIDPGRYTITRLGPWHPTKNPTLKAAKKALGKPSAPPRGGTTACRVHWDKYRLKVLFVNLGGHNACTPSGGLAQTVRIGRLHQWTTNKSLHVGHSVKRLRKLYPGAHQHGSRFWLRTAVSPIAGAGPYPVLAARVHHHKVIGFKGWVGAAGD